MLTKEEQRLLDIACAATRGPWGWRGHDDGEIQLRTLHSGQQIILSEGHETPCTGILHSNSYDWVLLEGACKNCVTYATWLESGDETRFLEAEDYPCLKLRTLWTRDPEAKVLRPVNKWAIRERPYRSDVAYMSHPDLAFIATFDPTTVKGLLERISWLEENQ